jgi:hypothetical protein
MKSSPLSTSPSLWLIPFPLEQRYIAEASPTEIRGTLTAINNFTITFGQCVAGIIDGAFSGTHQGKTTCSVVSGMVVAQEREKRKFH